MPEEPAKSPPPGVSKFRHIYGQSAQRNENYDWGNGRATSLAVNPKFLAACLEGSSGGQILVSKIEDTGKYAQTSRLSDHRSNVVDIKWNPFNDNILASASADNTVKVWYVRDDGSGNCIRTLTRHTRRVEQIEWHTTVDDVILTAGADSRMVLWDLGNDQVIFEVSDFNASSLSLSPNSSLFAATSRATHRVTVFDTRTGDAKKSAPVPHDGNMPPKVIFSSNKHLITFGNTKCNRRQFAIYSLFSFSSPLQIIDIDGASGQLLPVFDYDLNLLYITGKGDTVIRFYEVSDRAPFVVYLGESQQTTPHTALGIMPKRALSLSICEIFRLYRLSPQSLLVTPLAFIVPRRGDHFHTSLYPPTRGPTPSLSLAEWRAGLDMAPVQLQLRLGMPVATCKPVQLKGAGELVTADMNNDAKFRFLSQVTKPDYRVVSEREDCDDIMRIEEVKNKLQLSKENSIEDEESDSTLTMLSLSSRSEDEVDLTTASQISIDVTEEEREYGKDGESCSPSEEIPVISPLTPSENRGESVRGVEGAEKKRKDAEPTQKERLRLEIAAKLGSNPSIASAPYLLDRLGRKECESPAITVPIVKESAPLASLDDDSPGDILDDSILIMKSLSEPPMEEKENRPNGRLSKASSHPPPDPSPSIPPIPLLNVGGLPVSHLHVSSSARDLHPSPSGSDLMRTRKASPARSESGTLSRPGTISPRFGASTSREGTLEKKEKKYHYDTPKWAQRTNGNGPQYAHRCVDVEVVVDREEEDTESVMDSERGDDTRPEGSNRQLENAVSLLERELRKSDARGNQLDRLVTLQQQDIESLRFEIAWKDDRISFLQSELARLEATVPKVATPTEGETTS